MDGLTIHLFGGVEVARGSRLLPPFPTQKARALFAYLVMSRGRLLHRDVLMGLFWGDADERSARKGLRTALWRIRSVLEPAGVAPATYLRIEGQQVGFQGPPSTWVDVREFERRTRCVGPGCAAALDAGGAATLEEAVGLYRGHLLEGMYDEWCLAERERLKLTLISALECLMGYRRRRGEWSAAIARAQEILRHDPFREYVHRELMECHYAMGDRPSALRQYGECARILREELEIEPMEETQVLYRRIRAGESLPGPSPAASPAPYPARTGSVMDQVDGVLADLYAVASRLERARSVLEAAREPGD